MVTIIVALCLGLVTDDTSLIGVPTTVDDLTLELIYTRLHKSNYNLLLDQY